MVTSAGTAQLQRVDDPDGYITLLKIEHPSIETVFVVNDTRDWIIGGVTYVGLPFDIRLPSSIPGEPVQVQIAIDNVGRELTPAIEGLPPGGVLQATISTVSRARPTIVENYLSAPLTNIVVTTESFVGVIGNAYVLGRPAVKARYDPRNSPGIFAG